jgi:hypothetical protein
MALTFRTISRGLDSIITIMTLQGMIPEMIGEGYAAVRTLEGEAAIWAEDEIGKPSSIEKEQALLLIFDIFSECHLYLFRKDTPFPLHINHLHPRKGLSFDPLREIEEMKLSFLSIVERFEGRGG